MSYATSASTPPQTQHRPTASPQPGATPSTSTAPGASGTLQGPPASTTNTNPALRPSSNPRPPVPNTPGTRALEALQAIVDNIDKANNTLPKTTPVTIRTLLTTISSLASQALADIGMLTIWEWNADKLSLKSELEKFGTILANKVDAAIKNAVLGPQATGPDAPSSLREVVQAASTDRPLYSQVVSQSTKKPPAQHHKGPRPLETIISLADAQDAKTLLDKSDFEARGLVQRAIGSCAALHGISVHNARIRRSTKQIVITMLSNEASVRIQKHANEWLNKLAPGAKYAPRKFPVVLNGVPTSFTHDAILPQNHPICETQEDIDSIKWLAKGGIEGKQHASLLVNFTSVEAADRAIFHGMYADRHCVVHKYVPPPPQCYNCQKFGHFSASCREKGKPVCGRCAGPHELKNCPCPKRDLHSCTDSRSCPQIQKKCANCDGDHVSWDGRCPVKIAAETEARERAKEELPYYAFPEPELLPFIP